MPTEPMLDLIGGAGEKPACLAPPSAPSWEDLEYDASEMDAFALAPVRTLADRYFWLLEVDPLARNRRAQQLRQVLEERGIPLEDLRLVWRAS